MVTQEMAKRAATTTRQLKIALDAEGALLGNLRRGQFSFVLEVAAPAADQPRKLASAPAVQLAQFAKAEKRLCALALSDRDQLCHPLGPLAAELTQAAKKEVIVRITGAGGTAPIEAPDLEPLRKLLAELQSAGVVTVTAATRAARPEHPRDKKGRPSPWPEGYLDSTRLMRLLREHYPEFAVGAWVNPYKYNVADSFLQYLKMVKKLRTGAGFLVTTAGWDMRKLQELQWFMRSRGLNDPVLARLAVVRPREVPGMLAGDVGGLVISREFAALLQRESAVSDNQSLSAQIERLALQAAGCRLVGYSGVQLAGIQQPETAKAVLDRAYEHLAEYDTFAKWVEAWHDFHDQVNMAPVPHDYYVFEKLLDPDFPDYDPHTTRFTEMPVPPPSALDQWQFRAAAALGLAQHQAFPFQVLRRLVCGDDAAHRWRLDKTELLSAAGCPKGLEEGACTGSRPDGTCEFGHGACFYHQVLARATWRQDLDKLEDPP